MLIEPIKVEGLREFSRGLRKLDKDAPKGLRIAGNKAAQIVVDTAKPRVPLGPGRGGHALSSIRASSTRTAARVSAGSKRFPYYPWLDFGVNKSVRRPFIKQGRYIWKAYSDKKIEVERTLHDELINVAREAGLDPEVS